MVDIIDRVALNSGGLTTARTRTYINNNSYGAIYKIHVIKTITSREQRPSALKLAVTIYGHDFITCNYSRLIFLVVTAVTDS